MNPPYEVFYKSNTKYEITINPNDKHQFHGNSRRLELWIMDMQKLITTAFDNYGIMYKLYWECSEPRSINKEDRKKSSGSRLHFHGYFLCPNDVVMGNYLLQSVYKLSRWSDVQVNEYRPDYWPKYVSKQGKIIKALAKSYHIPLLLMDHQRIIKR